MRDSGHPDPVFWFLWSMLFFLLFFEFCFPLINNFINKFVALLPDRGPKLSSFLFYALIGLSKDFIPQEWNSRKSQKSHSRLFFFLNLFFFPNRKRESVPTFPSSFTSSFVSLQQKTNPRLVNSMQLVKIAKCFDEPCNEKINSESWFTSCK